jgi:glycosyltransferase involved in cell wall biosynthesis
MRVVFDATPLLSPRTGVGAFVEAVLARLPRRDVEVVAFAYGRLNRDLIVDLVPAGVDVAPRKVPARTTGMLWKYGAWPPIEYFTGTIDVVHGPNFVVPPSRSGVELVTIHDLTPVHYPQYCDRNTVRYPGHIRRALDRGAHVHAVSSFVADEVAEVFDLDAARIHVVYNGVPAITGGDAARGKHLARADRYILAVGTIEPRKNLAALVRAFDEIAVSDSEVCLVLAGDRGWNVLEFDEAMQAARHAERVRVTGRVTDEQRADLLAGAAVLAYPSRYEGFGLPPLEAMSVGVPVLATAVGALPEILGDGALLVGPTDDEIGAGLRRVLTDDELRARLVARGAERVARYSWDRCADELVELYERLAKIRGDRRSP